MPKIMTHVINSLDNRLQEGDQSARLTVFKYTDMGIPDPSLIAEAMTNKDVLLLIPQTKSLGQVIKDRHRRSRLNSKKQTILEIVKKNPDGIRVPTLIEIVGIPRTTIYRYMTDLIREGKVYMQQDNHHAHRFWYFPLVQEQGAES